MLCAKRIYFLLLISVILQDKNNNLVDGLSIFNSHQSHDTILDIIVNYDDVISETSSATSLKEEYSLSVVSLLKLTVHFQ